MKIAAGISALVLALVVLIVVLVRADNEWVAWCHSQGGHVVRDTKTTTVISSNGKPGTGTSTTSYCLTADNRLLDIQ